VEFAAALVSGWSVFSRVRVPFRHKTRPLAGRGVDGKGAPAMLRIAAHGSIPTGNRCSRNVSTVSVAPNQGLLDRWQSASDGLRNGGLSLLASALLLR
jgi:hypothetical protein